MKERNVALSIVLTIVTCGIYGIYWQMVLVDDLNELDEKENQNSGIVVFLLSLITCGIYWFVWVYKAGDRIDDLKVKSDAYANNRGLVYLIFALFGLNIVSLGILQADLNELYTKKKDVDCIEV